MESPRSKKTICLRAAKEAMQKKTVIAKGQHDFTGAHFLNGAALDLDDVVRPDAGQHALPSDLQTQTTAEPQTVRG